MIRGYKGIRPQVGARAFVDTSAQVIGDVEIGEDASVWMNAVVRGDVNRIRIGALVLNGAVVGEESIVAAGALVAEGMQVPPRSLVMGVPAQVRRPVTEEERAELRAYAENYVGDKDTYRAEGGECEEGQ